MTPQVSPTLSCGREKALGSGRELRALGAAVYVYNFARLSELGFLYVTSDQLVGGPW